MKRLFLIALLLLAAGCADFKQADTGAGLLLVPFVDAVTIEGRPYIRLTGKQSVALVDPVGARVVEFYLQRRAQFQLWGDEEKKLVWPAAPNVIGAEQLASGDVPGHVTLAGKLDQSHYWQSDGWPVGIELLSDRDGLFGGFFRKKIEANPDGSLTVRIELCSTAATTQPNLRIPPSTKRVDSHGQTVVREVTPLAAGWIENWRIIPSPDSTTQPANQPTSPR